MQIVKALPKNLQGFQGEVTAEANLLKVREEVVGCRSNSVLATQLPGCKMYPGNSWEVIFVSLKSVLSLNALGWDFAISLRGVGVCFCLFDFCCKLIIHTYTFSCLNLLVVGANLLFLVLIPISMFVPSHMDWWALSKTHHKWIHLESYLFNAFWFKHGYLW